MPSLLRLLLVLAVTPAVSSVSATAESASDGRKTIVLVAGPKSHGPEGNGLHDYGWSARLIKVMLEASNVRDQVAVEIYLEGWPQANVELADADTLMILSDGRDGDLFPEAPHLASAERVAFVDRLMKRGCGLVAFHFATFASDAWGEHVLDWNGAYFDWEHDGRRDWYSAIETLDTEVVLPEPEHPVARGVKPFRIHEEFYYNLRFRPDDPAVAPLLAVPALPGREPDGRIVGWARERPEGGRGFGTTVGHFYDNWRNEDFRKFVLNGLVWSAGIEVPAEGVVASFFERDAILSRLESATP